jgi:hypothetical protein
MMELAQELMKLELALELETGETMVELALELDLMKLELALELGLAKL